MKKILWLGCMVLFSCQEEVHEFDATGTFEATETIVSSQANGMLLSFDVEEGRQLLAGQVVGLVDTTQLFLQKKQLEAQIKAIGSQTPNVVAQTSFFDEQLVLNETQVANLERSGGGSKNWWPEPQHHKNNWMISMPKSLNFRNNGQLLICKGGSSLCVKNSVPRFTCSTPTRICTNRSIE